MNGNLSRSVSSAGERQSNTYSLPALPKRAETFSGFYQNPPVLSVPTTTTNPTNPEETNNSEIIEENKSNKPVLPDDILKALPNIPPLLTFETAEEQQSAVKLTHYLNSLLCMVSEYFTSLET